MNIQDVKLKNLMAFQLVGRYQSIQRAAVELGLSLPAVSIQLYSLESQLGLKLLRRIGRRTTFTPAGEEFSKKVDGIFASVGDALSFVSHEGKATESLSLVLSADLATRFSDVIGDFIDEHPTLKVLVQLRTSTEIRSLVAAGKMDLGVGYFDKIPRELVKRNLSSAGFSLVFTPEVQIPKGSRPSLVSLAKHRLIIVRNQSNLGKRVWRAFNEAGVEPAGVIEAGNCPLSLALAKKGVGVAIVHTPCMSEATRKDLRVVDFSRHVGTMHLAAVWHRSFRLSAIHLSLIDRLAMSLPANLEPTPRRFRK
jgi:DNA-binding transcriptional LysR family regulator